MNQRIALTKKLLKHSLIELLQTQSIYQISIRELCQNAEINRSTFYKYYGSQFDLLAEMEADLLENIEHTLSVHEGDTENVIEQIIVYLERDIDFVRLLFNSNVDPDFPKKLFSLKSLYASSNAAASFRSEKEYEYYSCFILHGTYEIVHKWINKENREPPAWVASLIFKLILHTENVKKRE